MWEGPRGNVGGARLPLIDLTKTNHKIISACYKVLISHPCLMSSVFWYEHMELLRLCLYSISHQFYGIIHSLSNHRFRASGLCWICFTETKNRVSVKQTEQVMELSSLKAVLVVCVRNERIVLTPY